MLLAPMLGQGVGDLNSLLLQGERYSVHVLAAQGRNRPLELFKLTGRSLGPPEDLMHTGADIQNWTLIYRVGSGLVKDGAPIRSAYLRCERGEFENLDLSPVPVMDCKSLAWRWVTIPVDEAIHRLVDSGFSRGFSQVTLMRPMHPSYPDQPTYVFNCPIETSNVGISAQTGELLWSETWNARGQNGPQPASQDPP
jgi:hypothetical protein